MAQIGVLLFVLGVVSQCQGQVPQSVNVIIFDGQNTLFVGDSQAATVHAYPNVAANSNSVSRYGYNLPSIGCVMAALLGTTPDNVLIQDLAVHPISKEAYISVHKIQGPNYRPAIVIMSQCGSARLFNLNTRHTSQRVNDAPTSDYRFWGKTPMRSLTFTDMKLHQNKLYVAGLSNAEFASTLRVLDYPFNGNTQSVSVENFHGTHSANETRSPIKTMLILNLNGRDYILAAYVCTPLVLIPVDEIRNGAHIRGKTIGELGMGNTPVDLVTFMGDDARTDQKFPIVLLSNRDISSQVIPVSEIAKAANQAGLERVVPAFETRGVPFTRIHLTNLIRIDNQDEMRLLGVRRMGVSGKVELVSFMKNIYLRPDNFVDEFDFPGYSFPPSTPPKLKAFLEMMHKELGYA